MFGALSDGRAEHGNGRKVAPVVMEMVLGKPDRVETIRFRSVGFAQHVLIELFFSRVELREETRQMKERESHCHFFPFSVHAQPSAFSKTREILPASDSSSCQKLNNISWSLLSD